MANSSSTPQAIGAIVLPANQLLASFLVQIISGGPQDVATTLGALAQIAGSVAAVGLTATGASQVTAALLGSVTSVFTTVAAGTGAAVPPTAAIGSVWEVWNAGANNLLIYPMSGAQIQSLGINAPATVVPGGRSKFVVNSATQVFAG